MLDLRLSNFAGRANISCDRLHIDSLNDLRSRFTSSTSVSVQGFDLNIDDFLMNLRELSRWPTTDQDVRWQPELLSLVEKNHADAQVLQSRLFSSADQTSEQPRPLRGWWDDNLTDFQKRDIKKLLGLAHGANFSVPGAGKTRVSVAIFQARKDAGEINRMLVVCPKSAFESWQYEAHFCHPDEPLRVVVMDGPSPPEADIVLINYERLPESFPSLIQWLRSQRSLLLLDEAHRMKLGASGAWGAACFSLGPYASHRMILTGTPAPNGAEDLENLFAFVWPGQGRAIVTNALSGKDLRAASALLRPVYARTTKNQLPIPPLNIAIRRIPLPPLHRDLYSALLGQLATSRRLGEQDFAALGKILLYLLMAATTPALLATGSSPHEPLPYRIPPLQPPPGSSLSELMRDLPQYELSPKYQEAAAIVAENAKYGRKTLVWSTFVRNLKSLESLLSRYQPAIIHGGTKDRTEQLKRFREDPDCLVLLSNPATLGEGVSLHQVCHDAVYIDRDFAAGRFMQSLDRIHRLGLKQDTRTQITILIADQTIDEIVERRLAAKLKFMGGVLDDPAVLQLGDLEEEPSETIGMDSSDVQELLNYLSGNVST